MENLHHGNSYADVDDGEDEDGDSDDNINDEKYVPKDICVTFQSGQWHLTD